MLKFYSARTLKFGFKFKLKQRLMFTLKLCFELESVSIEALLQVYIEALLQVYNEASL